MSTNSAIGIQNDNGTITAIYCHWDGHTDTNGVRLRDHYTTVAKINQLMALGALSSLGPEIGEKHDFDEHDPTVCTAYIRDRGAKYGDNMAQVYSTFEDFAEYEFNYLWKDGKWSCHHSNGHQLEDCATW